MKLIAIVGIALLLVLAGGCASGKRSVTTVETVECPAEDESGPAPDSECRTIREETVISHERVGGCDGILSCSFDVVGEVIALPFRILGVVLDVIF